MTSHAISQVANTIVCLLLVLVGQVGLAAEPALSGRPVPAALAAILKEVMVAASVDSVYVTSLARSPEQQVDIMYANASAQPPPAINYGPEGEAVLAVFARGRQRGDAETKIKADMLSELRAQLPAARAAGRLQHLFDDRWVVDISRTSIPSDKSAAFLSACGRHAKKIRCLGPGQLDDASFHFEFAKQ
jgi:hypothetical protein